MVRRVSKSVLFLTAAVLLAALWAALDVAAGGPGRCDCDCRCSRLDHFDRLLPSTLSGRGDDALAAVQRTVGLLLADRATDWSEVRITRLRQRLADLNEIVMYAEAEERDVPGGLEITVGGGERTLAALWRVVPEHARRMDGFRGWSVTAGDVASSGAPHVLTIRSDDPEEAEIIRGFGFFGFLASGVHRPQSHLAVARGKGSAG